MRVAVGLALLLCVVVPVRALAQGAPASAPPAWSANILVNTYFLPERSNVGQPVVTADRARLHLEARYNYEAIDTGSFWGGLNFSGGHAVEWDVTAMFGGVIGKTDGVAPGYRGSITWRQLELYSEGEYVFDAHDSASNYFYNWSEASWVPVEWFRVGLVTQRTRVYQSDRDIQRGVLIGGTFRHLTATLYVFNPDDSKPIYVLGVGIGF